MKVTAYICTLAFGLISTGASLHAQNIKISPGATTESTESADTAETELGRRAQTDELYFEALKAKQHSDDKQAESLLKQFIAKRPEVAAAHYELAKIYTDQKKLELATLNIKKALSIDPTNKWYKEAQALIFVAQGNYVAAANLYAELAKEEKQDQEYPVQAAEYYERAGKNQEAISQLDVALLRNLDDEDLMVHKMQLYLNMNNAEKAATVVQQMIAGDPRNGKYIKLLGEIYDNNKMLDRAGALYEQALKKLPNDPSVQLGFATHCLRKGDTTQYRIYARKAITNAGMDTEAQLELLKVYIQSLPDENTALAEALPIIAKLVEQAPDDALILEYYGEALEGNNMTDSAVAIYKKSLIIKPSNFGVWGRLLVSYQEKKYADSLIKYSEKAMRMFPNQAITHFYNGVGYLNKENYSSAIKAMNRAIDLQPETEKEALAQMYSTLADVYYSSKQFALSDETFEKALALDPNNATVLNNYSYFLSERGIKLDVAESMSKKSLELRPDEVNFIDTYGWILYKKGDFAKAKTYIEKAMGLTKDAPSATLYDHLGDILYKLNEKTKAIAAWKKAKETGSDDKNLDKKISEGKLYE
jgi:tetratricopeptide (TPR) repeat protein